MQGVVKFNCHWNQSGPVISDEQYEIINYWREILFNMDLIGAYENGVGFGNISMRIQGGNQFVITGSSTGEIPELEPGHYVRVNSFNIEDNAVHVHSIELWNELIYKVPTTNPAMDYGTTGLAKDILRLFEDSDVIEKRIIIMSGDRAGILTFGNDMDEAVNVLMEYLRK
jgi:hypothetical protein